MQNQQQIPQERKWAKSRFKDTFILPNEEAHPIEYKDAVKQNRPRLKLDFVDRDGFTFFLTQNSILRNLQNTSYSEQGPDKTIIVHLYYITKKRGRLIDFLAEKWKPYIREVTVDTGPINKTFDPQDELSAAITRLRPSDIANEEEREQHQQEGNLENEMEVEMEIRPEGESEAQLPDAEVRRLKRKRQRELQKEAGKMAEANIVSEDSDLNIERCSSELKKLKKEQDILKKKADILETALRQIANFTGKMITKASIKGEPPEEIKVMRQEVNAIFQTLKQQDTDMTLQDFAFDLFLKPEPELHTKPEEEQKDVENADANGDNFDLESPKSRVPTERAEDNVSSSCLHTSDDEGKPAEKPFNEESQIEPQQKLLQNKKQEASKKNKKKQPVQKEPWSHMTKGVLTIWQAIKLAIQRGESEEEMRQNKNTPSNWKPILDPDYEHRLLFLAFLKSQSSIDFNE